MESSLEPNKQCPGCSRNVEIPYIRCAECPALDVVICLHCFARGVEFDQHQNNHAYRVVKYKFSVYEKHWSAMDEVKLLDAVEYYGHGNWVDIASQLIKRTPAECERHYNKCYISNPQPPLPSFPEYEQEVFPTPIMYKLSNDPPRPREGTVFYTEMAGYSAPRGEFAVEHNNFAEMDICQLTFDEEEKGEEEEEVQTVQEAKLALVQSYRMKLRERHRRKRIIKEYGLINWFKMMKQYHAGLNQETRHQVSALQVFTTLMTPMENDKLIEALHYEQDLKNEICCLQEYRQNGLRLRAMVPIYRTLRSRRNATKHSRHLLSDVIAHIRDEAACQSWLKRHIGTSDSKHRIIPLPSAPRKSAPPLDIEGMDGYERLNPQERELCQTVRLVPMAYLEFRKVLVNECRKNCGLRLAQARTLIKIDVNKTRKLYDFLISDGQINKP